MTWLTVAGIALTIVLIIVRWVARVKSENRRLADEARAAIDKATKGGDESDILDGFGSINSARR